METVLIIEDQPETLDVLTEILSKHGYIVRTALDFDIALQSALHLQPDIILIDIGLPGIDGFKACQMIKSDQKLKHIPIIFLTAKTSLRYKINAFKSGAVDYITKPFVSEEVVARIKTHLSLQQERDRFYTMAEATTEGIIIHEQGLIIEVNSAIEIIFKTNRQQTIQKHLSQVFSPKTVKNFLNKKQLSCEIQEKSSEGIQLILDCRMRSIRYMGRDLDMIAVRDLTEKRCLEKENITLKTTVIASHRLADMVGKSVAIQKVFKKIIQLASIDETIFISGETGTGKELAAKCIHQLSDRANKPFIAVNCATIPETLFESIFFGYAKGAFTHAAKNKEGLFKKAQGGFLFLDEVTQLKPDMQAKLLRVIENGEYRPLGGKNYRADVRIISATNKSFKQMMSCSTIRDDFFHRLAVMTLEIPPLRKRKEDIPLLVEEFISRNREKNMNFIPITNSIINKLMLYHYKETL